MAPKRSGVPDFTAEFHARNSCLHIIRMRQQVVFDLERVGRVWPRQADLSPTLWLYDARQKRPAGFRRVESSCRFGAADDHFRLASLQIGGVESSVAFPKERGFASVVARGQRSL